MSYAAAGQTADGAGAYSAGAPAVEVLGLHLSRGRTKILRGLDFTVESGRITGPLGPSGSGKTTWAGRHLGSHCRRRA